MGTKRARLMPERQSLRFIVRPGAVQHQNGANVGAMVQELHIYVAGSGSGGIGFGGGVGNYLDFFILIIARSCLRRFSMATLTFPRIWRSSTHLARSSRWRLLRSSSRPSTGQKKHSA